MTNQFWLQKRMSGSTGFVTAVKEDTGEVVDWQRAGGGGKASGYGSRGHAGANRRHPRGVSGGPCGGDERFRSRPGRVPSHSLAGGSERLGRPPTSTPVWFGHETPADGVGRSGTRRKHFQRNVEAKCSAIKSQTSACLSPGRRASPPLTQRPRR